MKIRKLNFGLTLKLVQTFDQRVSEKISLGTFRQSDRHAQNQFTDGMLNIFISIQTIQ